MTPQEILDWVTAARAREDRRTQSDIARSADDAAIKAALSLATSDTDRGVIVDIAGFAQAENVVPDLLELLGSPAPSLRAASADALGKIIGYPPRHPAHRWEVRDALRAQLARENLGWVASTFIQSIGLVGVAEDDGVVLRPYVESSDRQERGQAVWALERLRSKPW